MAIVDFWQLSGLTNAKREFPCYNAAIALQGQSMTTDESRENDGFPTKEEVQGARRKAGVSQERAAQLAGLTSHTRWSEYERGVRRMDPARFELFLIKTDQHPEYVSRAVLISGRHPEFAPRG
jgi:DNA-binding XRE family transcriptional regulator